MQYKKTTYYHSIREGISSLKEGIGLTLRHLFQAVKKRKPLGIENKDYFVQDTGIVTTEYPKESIPVPDNGRYKLHNEIDDCIVCDLCAKICPVNCIDIVPVKSPEEIGKTSDGTTKRIYAARFDIDMAKCCYCGLCTTVCPTECLTMTNTYDFSEFDIRNMNYKFSEMTEEEAERRKQIYAEYELQKQKIKDAAIQKPNLVEKKAGNIDDTNTAKPKPSFKPVIKSPTPELENKNEAEDKSESESVKPKPVFKPVIKPKLPTSELSKENTEDKKEDSTPVKPKPVFKPVIKVPPKKDNPEL